VTDHPEKDLLQQMFADSDLALVGDNFTAEVMSHADPLKRRRIIRRVMLGFVVALIAIPLEDIGLALARFLLSSLVEIDDSLAAELLAPVNSVGSLLSFVLLSLRVAHKKLFT
jgi:hypothetical protein